MDEAVRQIVMVYDLKVKMNSVAQVLMRVMKLWMMQEFPKRSSRQSVASTGDKHMKCVQLHIFYQLRGNLPSVKVV